MQANISPVAWWNITLSCPLLQ